MPQIPVSVIIPHHNRSDRIGRAIASVQAQTLPVLEILIVDDASDAHHRRELLRFSDSARIIHSDTNVGPAGARNLGIAEARGDALAFLDDDDEWTPDKFEKQWPLLSANDGLAAVTSAILVVDFNTGAVLDTYHKRSSGPITLPMALEATPAMIQTLLIRAPVIKALGGFDARFPPLEDQEFFIRLISSGASVTHVPETLARLNRGFGDHLSNQKWSFLRGEVNVVEEHAALYDKTFGPRGARIVKSRCFRRAGIRWGGVLGRSLYAWGCVSGRAYAPLWTLLKTARMEPVPYSALHTT